MGGEGIGDKRWSSKRKKAIRDSRVDSTSLISDAILKMENKPEVLILASAIGWYGNRGEEELDEESESGRGFLPEVCADWESAAMKVKKAGVRTVFLRTGIVLTATSGALGKMLLPFQLGLEVRWEEESSGCHGFHSTTRFMLFIIS